MIELFKQYPWLWIGFATVVSAAVGSFLNVLIYRLPKIRAGEKLGIGFPLSHCPACQTPLKYRHNVPIFSYLCLRGRCAFCRTSIAVHYLILELLAALGGAVLASLFGVSWLCIGSLLLLWSMLYFGGAYLVACK